MLHYSGSLQVLLPAALSLTLVGVGCSSGGQRGDIGVWEATCDTVGDTLVVRTLSGSIWRDTAHLVPEVSIGMLDGPEEFIFGRIVSLAMARDGTIYIVDGHVPALRVFNADGSYRTTFGRKGGGPGEYERPDAGLGVLSDGRVVLRDPGNARMQVFSPDGEALESWRIRGGNYTSRRMVVDVEDRSHAFILLNPEAPTREWKTALVQVLPDGSPGDTLEIPDTPWEPPRIEAFRQRDDGGISRSVSWVPFAPRESAVLSPMGYFIHAISSDYALTLLRPEAPLRITKEYDPVAVASGERMQAEAVATRDMRHTDPNWRWNGPPIPDTKPPFLGFFAGEDGTVWVQVSRPAVEREDPDYDPTDPDAIPDEWWEPILFDVFDSQGRHLGAVKGPEGLSTYIAPILTTKWVLATVRDELDVQRVVRYRVVLPGARTRSEITAQNRTAVGICGSP